MDFYICLHTWDGRQGRSWSLSRSCLPGDKTERLLYALGRRKYGIPGPYDSHDVDEEHSPTGYRKSGAPMTFQLTDTQPLCRINGNGLPAVARVPCVALGLVPLYIDNTTRVKILTFAQADIHLRSKGRVISA